MTEALLVLKYPSNMETILGISATKSPEFPVILPGPGF
jgi:hypothetical protein